MTAGNSPDFFTGVLLGAVVLGVSPLLVWIYARSLGALMVRLRIGSGPVVHRAAGAAGLTELRTLPLSFRPTYLPRRETYSRDYRRIMRAVLVVPIVLAAVLAALVPGVTTLTMFVLVLFTLARWVAAVEPGTRRRRITRILVRTTPGRDPLDDPLSADIDHGAYAVGRGDFEAAQESISRLRADPAKRAVGEKYAAGVHEIRGEYAAALECLARIGGEGPTVAQFDRVHVRLLMTEVDPATSAEALSFARQSLDQLPRGAASAQISAVQAMVRVVDGSPADARAYAAGQLARSGLPVTVADALCTQARIEAASGRLEQASRTLRSAQDIAPWYARVGIVRGLLGLEAAANLGRGAMDTTAPDQGAFDDPWSVTGR